MTIEHFIRREQELEQRICDLEEKLSSALVQVAWLQKQLFGQGKSERQDALQMQLQLEEAMAAAKQAQEALKETIQYERTKPGKTAPDRILPHERFANVPVGETIEIIPDEVKAAPELYRKIDVEETFEIDIKLPSVFKRLILRPRYVLIEDRSMPPIVAPAPKRIIENSYASAGLIAWVVVSKYLDHLPLYRQEKIFNRYQVFIARQRMCDWIAEASTMIEIIYRRMKLELLSGGYVNIDETPVEFIDPDQKKGKTTQGFFWVMTGPGGLVVVHWEKTRNQQITKTLLKDFRGVVQCDGNSVYNVLDDMPGVQRVACLAHCRRKFADALQYAPVACRFIIRLIGNIYHFEKQCDERRLAPKLRAILRLQHLEMTLKLLKSVLLKLATGRPTAALVKACKYMIGQWEDLVKIRDMGHVKWDNNAVENAIRPTAVGKKNWLFVGAPDAGQRSAILYSIMLTCDHLGIQPLNYLRDVLTRLPQITSSEQNILPLLPHNWKAASIEV